MIGLLIVLFLFMIKRSITDDAPEEVVARRNERVPADNMRSIENQLIDMNNDAYGESGTSSNQDIHMMLSPLSHDPGSKDSGASKFASFDGFRS